MKKLHNIKWFSVGVVVTLILSLSVPAIAASLTKTATLNYNNIKITLDNSAVTPKDANGNVVEPFIIDGTTYLPVRAVAGVLGLGVEWDGATNTVKLSTKTAPVTTPSGNASSYQSILDSYSEKLKKETPRLIAEYNAEAANNTGGIVGLAEISNAKIAILAEISSEGISEMANYMLSNGSGSYAEYEEWAGKLTAVYMEEAAKITDAYMNSAS